MVRDFHNHTNYRKMMPPEINLRGILNNSDSLYTELPRIGKREQL